jgi:5-amino-6-(5-phosphoribosylamino)uracil reductase/diaminohydroxyphosphoribosylaminopyrimidine deaminase/5-amino-6-(5-phosphoribosylamino)uracil reductase
MPRPYVTLSWGQTLDGRIATLTGDSQWIGGPESLTFAHELRRDNQAIVVGIGTVLKDNPRLTCRIPGGRNPLRVVLDSSLRLPVTAALADTAEAGTVVFTANLDGAHPTALEARNVEVVRVAALEGRLDLSAVLSELELRGIETVFVEGGAAVLTAFLAAGLADRVVVVTAPFLLGKGIEAVGDLGHRVLALAPRPLSWRRWELGDDLATELIFR